MLHRKVSSSATQKSLPKHWKWVLYDYVWCALSHCNKIEAEKHYTCSLWLDHFGARVMSLMNEYINYIQAEQIHPSGYVHVAGIHNGVFDWVLTIQPVECEKPEVFWFGVFRCRSFVASRKRRQASIGRSWQPVTIVPFNVTLYGAWGIRRRELNVYKRVVFTIHWN